MSVPSRPSPRWFNAATVFRTAWICWIVAAIIGLLLRWHPVMPVPGLRYGYTLHAHSHVAFLGWVFNAFFALALQVFIAPPDRPRFARLFLVLQVAVLGMLCTYPLQGYARESIAFSTLHMVGSGVFAWKLLRRSRAAPIPRRYLQVGLGAMLLSGLGPLTLGPLAALGYRESPAYLLCIYFYLHFQYNGWFLFFLQAVLLQRRHDAGITGHDGAARQALAWQTGGCLLTFALSTLWLDPPRVVHATAAAGGAALLVGAGFLLRAIRGSTSRLFPRDQPVPRLLAGLALGLFLTKNLLQLLAATPALVAVGNQRPVVIGFLHLIFLGVVTPLLIAWAIQHGWLQLTRSARMGLALLGSGAALTEIILFLPALTAFTGEVLSARAEWLLAGAALMAGGTALMAGGLRARPASATAPG